MARKKKVQSAGLSVTEIKNLINKKVGIEVAFDLNEDNPSEVTEWIPTGSRWLDSIICRGQLAGIPVGRITEIASLSGVGKSYMAAQIAANAQKQGFIPVYMDSESATDPNFLQKSGCDLDNLLFVQTQSVEMVLETIETLLATGSKYFFIWDSLAMTPAMGDIENDFNPQSSMALKARILALGMSKLINSIANTNSVLLILNQLKTNITRNFGEAITTPYVTPGGKAVIYAYSLRIWLTGRKAKKSFIEDENGYRIGSEVKVTLEKSRFGSQGRQCAYQILWGDEVRIADEESWLEVLKGTELLVKEGHRYVLGDRPERFHEKDWLEMLKNEDFRKCAIECMDKVLIHDFKNKSRKVSEFYDIDGEIEDFEQKEEEDS